MGAGSKGLGKGRGLKELLGGGELRGSTVEFDEAYPVEELRPDPSQPRQFFDEEALEELAANMKELGMIQPIVARKTAQGALILAGERRWRAAKKAGMRTVPVRFVQVDEVNQALMTLAENLQRQDLTALEVARGLRDVLEAYHMTQEELAHRMGMSRPAVSGKLRLLELPEVVQQALQQRLITEGHGRALCRLDDEALQEKVLGEALQLGMSVRAIEGRVARLLEGAAAPARPKPKAKRLSAAARFAKATGLKVKVTCDEVGDHSLTLSGLSEEAVNDLLTAMLDSSILPKAEEQ